MDNEETSDQVAKSSIHASSSLFNRIPDAGEVNDDDGVAERERAEVDEGLLLSAIKATTTTQSATPTLPAQTGAEVVEAITRRMDSSGGSIQLLPTARKPNSSRRRPQKTTPHPTSLQQASTRGGSTFVNRRRPHKVAAESFERASSNQLAKDVRKKSDSPARTYRPIVDYDYYDDEDVRVVGNTSGQQLKVILHGGGIIECLDQGNFPHPLSCRKFISCAKFETGGVVGWEYTCPRGLSYDPVGGMCNWAAGLGCKEQ